MTHIPPLLREPCPAGARDCQRDMLLESDHAAMRVLLLTKHEEKKLIERLKNLKNYDDLVHMQHRIEQQLGVRIQIEPNSPEVRSIMGFSIYIHPVPGLCSKTKKSIPAAIRVGLKQTPEIMFELLNRRGLFA